MFRFSGVIVRIFAGVFLFSLGRGFGSDTFFSIYLNEILNNHVLLVGCVAAIMPLIKMLFALPIGVLDDSINLKKMLRLSKIAYIVCGILFFIAGRVHQPRILIIAVIINGFASAGLFTTYETYIRSISSDKEGARNFGLYLTGFHGAHVIGALICALFINQINTYGGLKIVFLGIVIFSAISLIGDLRLPAIHHGTKNIFPRLFNSLTSKELFRRIWRIFWKSTPSVRFFLILEFLYSILNYIAFLFIPLLAAQQHMSLSEIAILYAVMRAPYMLSVILARFWERYPQKLPILLLFALLAVFCFGLSLSDKINTMFLRSLALSLGLAFAKPMILGGISKELSGHHLGVVTGIQQSVGMLGNVIGSLGFAILSSFFSIPTAFSILGIMVIIIVIWLGIRLRSLFHSEDIGKLGGSQI